MNSLFQPAMPGKKNRKRRHQMLFDDGDHTVCGSITSLDSLRSHLQTAIEIEHATIPPYLCALYSIKEGTNPFAYANIQSVVMEEMLHMLLAANILNAIGGQPAINQPDFIPEYPTYLPHSDDAFLVPLGKFSKDSINVFLDIEQPAAKCAPPQADNWHTIGQFYDAIKHALRHFDHITPGGIFTGNPDHQLTENDYYGGGGKLVKVVQLSDALLGINEIIGQGEGRNGTILDTDHSLFGEEIDYAHYFKFNEILLEKEYRPTDKPQDSPSGPSVKVEWDEVWNMQLNPKMADYPEDSQLYQKTLGFNQTYMALLDSIHNACNGNPRELDQSIPLMYDLKYKALELMRTPIGDGVMAGPSFEYVESRG